MKAKLLKLLRKQANKEYKIKPFKNRLISKGKVFYVISYYCFCRNRPFKSWYYLEHAEKYIKEAKREYILFRIRELRNGTKTSKIFEQ